MKPYYVLFLLATWNPPLNAQSALPLLADGFEFRAPLNDTGQNWCANATNGNLSCPQAGFPDQDGDHGRDARARQGQLSKIGGGWAGFDYTKISNSGAVLPASAVLGSGPSNWGCTRDNVTGLIWEVKPSNLASLRHRGHTYTWYSADASVNGGVPGTLGSSITCNSTLPQCNTQDFVAAVNAQSLCGANDWRLPTPQELMGIVNYRLQGALVDATYFPDIPFSQTTARVFWAGRSLTFSAFHAWNVSFMNGYVSNDFSKSNHYGIRLVRSGQ